MPSWKDKYESTKKSVMSSVAGVVDTVHEKTSKALDTTLTLEDAQNKLVDDLKKGLRVFDELGMPAGKLEDLQEEITTYLMEKLVANFPKQENSDE